ncbi:sulfurtransferase complex subunit TusB [Pseudomonas sp. LRF_L74]|uniref:sulfurtransferase complex subunit TusB n=1 Tax=Pseudomonas sp. LRF_L74 TaxID=3369422 RepID=UPI003F63E321
MATLHMLSHSPFGDERFASCLRLLGAHDGLLLTGDAVYALQPGTAPAQALLALPIPVHALAEDLQARNITASETVIAIDYPAFVALCGHYDKVNSWL